MALENAVQNFLCSQSCHWTAFQRNAQNKFCFSNYSIIALGHSLQQSTKNKHMKIAATISCFILIGLGLYVYICLDNQDGLIPALLGAFATPIVVAQKKK